ncbi:conserved hypothetical protein, membrane [Candidatus Magnetomorum sp. HK-1]|nr:conserved hypothetical protein, membrane [Candidatus Magnetomorum sp. HK-1]
MKITYCVQMFICLMISFVSMNNYIYAAEPKESINDQLQSHRLEMMIIERLARIEEGQKSIINEMRTRFEAVDKRFEAVDQRFEAVDQRFEAVDQRFESLIREMNERFDSIKREMNERFNSIQREMNERFEAVNKRFESLDKRIDALDKRIDQLNMYFLAMIGIFTSMFLAIMGYAIWDRRTLFEKAREQVREETIQLIKDNQREYQSVILNIQEKFQVVIDIMKKMSDNMPEMRSMMRAAQLL